MLFYLGVLCSIHNLLPPCPFWAKASLLACQPQPGKQSLTLTDKGNLPCLLAEQARTACLHTKQTIFPLDGQKSLDGLLAHQASHIIP